MNIQDKINFMKERFNTNIDLLVLNVDEAVLVNECKHIAYYILNKNINTVSNKEVKEKISTIVEKFRNKDTFSKEECKNLIQKIVCLECYELGIDFAVKKIDNIRRREQIGINEYKNNINKEIEDHIKRNDIVFTTDYYRIKSYEVQYIKYMQKTIKGFDKLYIRLYAIEEKHKEEIEDMKKEGIPIEAVNLIDLFRFNKPRILNIQESHDYEINSEWFEVITLYNDFLHNLVITLELYLKMIIVSVDLCNKKDERSVLEKVVKLGHNYLNLLGELEGKDNFTDNSSRDLNSNHISNQINTLSKCYKSILEKLDHINILQQVRYGENTSNEKETEKITTNEVLSLFVFLRNTYQELMKYRRIKSYRVEEGFSIKDEVTFEKYNKDGELIECTKI